MKRHFFYSIVGIILFVNISCQNSDIHKELKGNYFYRNEGGEMKQILVNKGNFKKEIYGRVLSYDYNREFIIVSQIPSKSDYIGMLSFYLRDDTVKYPEDDKDIMLSSEKEADSLIAHDPYYQKIFANDTNYWVIQIAHDSLIGPLTKSEFEIIRKELKIPKSLKLE